MHEELYDEVSFNGGIIVFLSVRILTGSMLSTLLDQREREALLPCANLFFVVFNTGGVRVGRIIP
jgi:hypothetical protein